MQKNWIYLDHAATTPIMSQVREAMLPFLSAYCGNPSAAYSFSEEPRRAIAQARAAAAALIGARAEEIYFTSGGTESDNWALTAAVECKAEEIRQSEGTISKEPHAGGADRDHTPQIVPHLITTQIEHPAVLRTCEYLERRGYAVTYLNVDSQGFADPAAVEAAIRPETALISVMMANNEIGTIEPIREIGEIARRHDILFHTDAVQAVGHVPVDVREMHIDLLSASGHKFGGPKGAGFLFIRKGIPFQAFLRGGEQERGRRAGTENVPGIAGLGKAAEIAAAGLAERTKACGAGNTAGVCRDHLVRRILTEIPGTRLNGPEIPDERTRDSDSADMQPQPPHRSEVPMTRLPGNANITFDGVSAESLLIALDMKGICVSAGSACSAGALDPSHVLLAIGLSPEAAKSTIRLTAGEENTLEEMDRAVEILKQAVERIRSFNR